MAQEERVAELSRTTKETDISLSLDIDGTGKTSIDTGVAFFDHMLDAFGRHGLFDLNVKAEGDIEVDAHHTVEDVGIVLGKAFAQAMGEKRGITRFASQYLPMDETLARVCLDLSNRPYLHYQVQLQQEKIGSFDSCLAQEFLRAFSLHAGCTLHVDLLHGENGHHIVEAIFKALGQSLRQAVAPMPGLEGQFSSKGTL